jgi:hypothetical protein
MTILADFRLGSVGDSSGLGLDTSFKKPAWQALYESNAFRSSDHHPVIVGLNLADPMGDTEAVLADLAGLLPTGDAKTDRRLNKAVDSIEASLNPSRWTSDQTITNKRVFGDWSRRLGTQPPRPD